MFSTPDLCDAFPNAIKILDPIFNNYGGNQKFYGQVVTLKCFEDNSKVKQLAAEAGRGRVLVVDGGGSLRRALLGDMIAANAVKNGWAGLVINGCIRDCDEIAELALGVKALNTIPVKTDKRDLGDVDVPVTFAGQTIEPGDWIYGDNNGIIVSKFDLLRQ
ncbi:MAG: ribonuclease E activity regulator RraA [Marinicella sp.]|nr:ribonuclease E activity regulator RraA [Xanthomonadales bacterium]